MKMKTHRIKNEITQKQAAEKFGVSVALIISIENDRRAMPDYIRAHIETLLELTEAKKAIKASTGGQ